MTDHDHDQDAIAQSPQNERRSCRHCGEQYWTLDAAHQCVGSLIEELAAEKRMVEIERAAAERCAAERDERRAAHERILSTLNAFEGMRQVLIRERDEALRWKDLAIKAEAEARAERDEALARVTDLERLLLLIGERALVDFDNLTLGEVDAAVKDQRRYKEWLKEVYGNAMDAPKLRADNERLRERFAAMPDCKIELRSEPEAKAWAKWVNETFDKDGNLLDGPK